MLLLQSLDALHPSLGSLVKEHLKQTLGRMCDVGEYTRALDLADQCIDAGVNPSLGNPNPNPNPYPYFYPNPNPNPNRI